MENWENPILTLVESFGHQAESIGVLIKFLCVLPEELVYNTKISLDVLHY
jgi:hypothetical protein